MPSLAPVFENWSDLLEVAVGLIVILAALASYLYRLFAGQKNQAPPASADVGGERSAPLPEQARHLLEAFGVSPEEVVQEKLLKKRKKKQQEIPIAQAVFPGPVFAKRAQPLRIDSSFGAPRRRAVAAEHPLAASVIKSLSADDLQKFVLFMEILGPPRALRPLWRPRPPAPLLAAKEPPSVNP